MKKYKRLGEDLNDKMEIELSNQTCMKLDNDPHFRLRGLVWDKLREHVWGELALAISYDTKRKAFYEEI